MPKAVVVVGGSWETGDELPEVDWPVLPRIGEGMSISNTTGRVADIIHELTTDAAGKGAIRTKVLLAPPGRQTLMG